LLIIWIRFIRIRIRLGFWVFSSILGFVLGWFGFILGDSNHAMRCFSLFSGIFAFIFRFRLFCFMFIAVLILTGSFIV
jgi:hypothetical protein